MAMPAWLERAAPSALGAFLGTTASPRKRGLFLRHLCRCFAELFTDPRSLAALDAADRFEAGEIDEPAYRAAVAAVAAAEAAAEADGHHWRVRNATYIVRTVADQVYSKGLLPEMISFFGPSNSRHSTSKKRTARAVRLVFFEHFGDIRRPAALDPKWLAWNHGTVPAIARRIDNERAFGDLPILADALEDAGCTDPDILGHCRGPGPHVRGCWAIDRVLGRS
jgi:hypothetical protein